MCTLLCSISLGIKETFWLDSHKNWKPGPSLQKIEPKISYTKFENFQCHSRFKKLITLALGVLLLKIIVIVTISRVCAISCGNKAYNVPRAPPPSVPPTPALNKEKRRQYGLCSQGDYSIDPRIYLPIELFTFSPVKISFFCHVCRKLRWNDGPRPRSMAPLSRVDSRYIALNTWCPLICYVKLFTHFLTTHAALNNNIINKACLHF